MPISASIVAAVIPMAAYLLLLWRFDRFEPEPIMRIIKHFLWGALGAIILALIAAGILSYSLEVFVRSRNLSFLEIILIAPFVEEITKGSYLLVSSSNKNFDNMTDGLIYGGAIGLGFGMTENLFYFISYGDSLSSWFYVVLIRTGFSAVMHCVATGTLGAFLAAAKFRFHKNKNALVLTGLLSAMLIHFTWNYSVSFASTFVTGIIMLIILIAVFIFILKFSVNAERKLLLVELKDEVPNDHISILTSNLRLKKGWVDESIRSSYIRVATLLAFRKRQLVICDDKYKESYEKDIMELRSIIQKLLKVESVQ